MLEEAEVEVRVRQPVGKPRRGRCRRRQYLPLHRCERLRRERERASRDHSRLVDVRVLVDCREQVVHSFRRLRVAKKQIAAGAKRILERLDGARLGVPVQIDEEIAAAHQVQMGERRVLEHVVMRKQDRLSQVAAHPVLVALADEEPAESLGRDVGHICMAVASLARIGDCGRVEIGREDLQHRGVGAGAGHFRQQHGDRVRFLPRCTAGNPHPHLVLRVLVLEQPRHDRVLEYSERLRIAKEVRDADQQLALERLNFVRVIPQEHRVRLDARQFVQLLPPADAPEHCRSLVLREVVTGTKPDQRQDVRQHVEASVRGRLRSILQGIAHAPTHRQEPRRHLRHRQNVMHQPGRDRVARHVVVLALARVLRHDDPAVFVHPLEAVRSVGPGA